MGNCVRCGTSVKPIKTPCPGSHGIIADKLKRQGQAGDGERIPGEFCRTCLKFVEEIKSEVKKGGIPWTCSDCMATGVEKADTPFSKSVRAHYPEGVMVQVSKKNGCPVCSLLSMAEG